MNKIKKVLELKENLNVKSEIKKTNENIEYFEDLTLEQKIKQLEQRLRLLENRI